MSQQNSEESARASHLFHDTLFGDIYSAIDARERLAMREVNAREDRVLQYFSRIVDRASVVATRRLSYEQR